MGLCKDDLSIIVLKWMFRMWSKFSNTLEVGVFDLKSFASSSLRLLSFGMETTHSRRQMCGTYTN